MFGSRRDHFLLGRDIPMEVTQVHVVTGRSLQPPYPAEMQEIVVGMGCFWGAEKRFWSLPGVWVTAVGYAGGETPNPTYEEVCSDLTGHAEVVRVIYDPRTVSLQTLLKVFWESHDPTQGMRQGNDIGSQYRSVIYLGNESQKEQAEASRDRYQQAIDALGLGKITTEIGLIPPFYFAENRHQQYLAKHPNGYCGLGGTGACYGDVKPV